jgi:hypothetical protein
MAIKRKKPKITAQVFLDKIMPQRRAINAAREVIKGWEVKYINAFARFRQGETVPLPETAYPPYKTFLIDKIEVRVTEDETFVDPDEVQYNIQFVYHGEFLAPDIEPKKGTLKIDPPQRNGKKTETPKEIPTATGEGDA